MNQNQKLIAGFIGLILIAFIGFFVFIFNDFTPPEKPKEETKKVNSESKLNNDGNSQKNSINAPNNNISVEGQKNNSSNNGTVILVRVKYSDGTAVPGLTCKIAIIDGMQRLYSTSDINLTNDRGECIFPKREMGKSYQIDLSSNQNSVFYKTIFVEVTREGEKIEKEVVINKSELESHQESGTSVKCTDSDSGRDYYHKGTTAGAARCIMNGVSQDCPGGPRTNTDVCVQGNYDSKNYGEAPSLNEFYCDPKDGRITVEGFLCPKGCKDGACITDVNLVPCIDSDGGKNYFVRGQSSGTETNLQAPGSQYGLIIGQDPNRCSFGQKSNSSTSVVYDCCYDSQSSKQLNEAFCDTDGKLSAVATGCPNGCKDGACIK